MRGTKAPAPLLSLSLGSEVLCFRAEVSNPQYQRIIEGPGFLQPSAEDACEPVVLTSSADCAAVSFAAAERHRSACASTSGARPRNDAGNCGRWTSRLPKRTPRTEPSSHRCGGFCPPLVPRSDNHHRSWGTPPTIDPAGGECSPYRAPLWSSAGLRPLSSPAGTGRTTSGVSQRQRNLVAAIESAITRAHDVQETAVPRKTPLRASSAQARSLPVRAILCELSSL